MIGDVAAWVPVIAALVGAAIGFVGAGGVRLLLDRRQELVRAQNYARVILDELRSCASLLDPDLELDNPVLATEPLPTMAWVEHRTDVAAVLLHEEFVGLSSTYRMIGAANHISERVRRDWEVAAATQGRAFEPRITGDVLRERQYIRLAVEQIGIPCIQWLAEGDLPFFRRRRVQGMTLTPYPHEPCRCGHRWDCHRWTWGRRRIYFRWHKSKTRSVAHECNVEGCDCRRFSWAPAPSWQRPLRRLQILQQAPHIGRDEEPPPPEPDPSIPDTAQPGAVVSLEEHASMEQRDREREAEEEAAAQ